MMARSLADFFHGCNEHEYAQIVAVEVTPGAIVGGNATGFTRKIYTSRTLEQTFTFLGAPEDLAFSVSEITVTDAKWPGAAAARSYTFAPRNSVTDGSTGTASFEKEIVTVAREKVSPRLYNVTVTRRGSALWQNNACLIQAPAWASAMNS